MKILIPNVTGPNNIGDEAILHGLLLAFKKVFNQYNLTIHTYDKHKYPSNFAQKIDYSIYAWTAFEQRNILTRLVRLFDLIDTLVDLILFNRVVGSNKLRALIKDYKTSELIYFVGGGYLRARAGITQSINLIMQLIMIWLGVRLNKSVMLGPISFGPFAYRWQEKLAAWVVKSVPYVFVRETVSLEKLHALGVKNIELLADTAFFINKNEPPQKFSNKLVIGFAIREWGDREVKERFVQNFVDALLEISRTTQSHLQPLVQVHSPEYGISDFNLTYEVVKQLTMHGIQAKPTLKVENIPQALGAYGGFDVLIGVRMHSVIIAATQHVPAVAIAYEHKTDGIMTMLELSNYVLQYKGLQSSQLAQKVIDLVRNRQGVRQKLQEKMSGFYESEFNKLVRILSNFKTVNT